MSAGVDGLSVGACRVYGLLRADGVEREFGELLKFVRDRVEMGGGVLIRLGVGRGEMGLPHVVFSYGGRACGVWLLVGRGESVEEKNMRVRMVGGGWVCGVVSNHGEFLEFLGGVR